MAIFRALVKIAKPQGPARSFEEGFRMDMDAINSHVHKRGRQSSGFTPGKAV